MKATTILLLAFAGTTLAQSSSIEADSLAKSLFPKLLITPENVGSSDYDHLRNRPGLKKAVDNYASGHYPEALRELGEYYRLKLVNPEAFGIPAEVTDPYNGLNGAYGPFLTEKQKERASNSKPPKTADEMARAFVFTHDKRLLQSWADTVKGGMAKEKESWPLQFELGESKGDGLLWSRLKVWAAVAQTLKEDPTAFPAMEFLRLIDQAMPDKPLKTLLFHRSNPRNWTIEDTYFSVALGCFFDELKIGPEMFREGIRVLESYGTTHIMPDGTENQQMYGYNFMYVIDGGRTHRLLDRIKSLNSPFTGCDQRLLLDRPYWSDLVYSIRYDCATRLLRMTGADGCGPIGLRKDRRKLSGDGLASSVPGLDRDPDSERIILRLNKKDPSLAPGIRSEMFPFGGYMWMRESWNPKDQAAFVFCSPQPGALAGFLSERNNNAMALQAFGQDLLVAGDRGAYSKRPSPVLVDNLEQCAHLGLGAPLPAWTQPGDYLFSDSENFIVAEGFYSGPYGDRNKEDEGIHDTTHRRLVIFLRQEKKWIVADEMTSPVSHTYRLDWRLPILPARDPDYVVFKPQEIVASINDRCVVTTKPAAANVSLQFFGPPLQKLDKKEERGKEVLVSDFLRIGAQWNTSGTMISLIEAFQGTAPEKPKALTRPGISGFEGINPQGWKYYFAATQGNAQTLPSFENLTVVARRLLVCVSTNGMISGIVLGCRQFDEAGHPQSVPGEDFEFLKNSRDSWSWTPLFRPIAGPVLEPSRELFLPGETIQLRCATPNAVIRYTVDGSPVTDHSALYTRPIPLEKNVLLRARSFRSEATPLTASHSGTHFSHETRGILTVCNSLWPALTVKSSPGLEWKHYEGKWNELWFRKDTLKPKAAGLGDLFANVVRGESPSDFLQEYRGYLTVPQSGIYTFKAPEHYTHDNLAAGYELDLHLDGHRWYPGTGRHAFGIWSVPLAAGAHRFELRYLNFRRQGVREFNKPNRRLNWVWEGQAPPLQFSGATLREPSPIPSTWLSH